MSTPTAQWLAARLERLGAGAALCVAFSGGGDSTALLHLLAAGGRGNRVLRAAHVDHGLHPDSARWAAHCRVLCERLGVALEVLRVDGAAARGESPEAAARVARYAALAGCLAPGESLLTAHHLDDQAETLLLQLLRGAGPRGLAAMPEGAPLGDGTLLRPLLGVKHAALLAYCHAHGIAWLEDPANRFAGYERAFVRHELLPLLQARHPGVVGTLARAARHQADAARLCALLAAQDLDASGVAEGTAPLPVAGLLRLEAGARRRNALRAWIARHGLPAPSEAQLLSVLRFAVPVRGDAVPVVRWPGAEIRRYRSMLYAMRPLPPPAKGRWAWRDPGEALRLPGGVLYADAVTDAGIAARAVPPEGLVVRFRSGGESLRPAGSAHRRALKKLMQETGLPPWERARLPLVFAGGRLVAVPDLCVAGEVATHSGEPGWRLRWEPRGHEETS